jgi:hypothetical protein
MAVFGFLPITPQLTNNPKIFLFVNFRDKRKARGNVNQRSVGASNLTRQPESSEI